VRLAMLGLASSRKEDSPLWWGYPPGVFIGYKWNGKPMQDLVAGVAAQVRGLGYQAFLDVENLDENADAYFQIPGFITSLQDCTFYVLPLNDILVPNPIKLSEAEIKELSATVAQFDRLFLDQQWDASDSVLRETSHFEHAFDHGFRRMLHSIYTANQANLDAVLSRLHSTYGSQIVYHLYKGYCARHRIPCRAAID
jgi:hypothetical protein